MKLIYPAEKTLTGYLNDLIDNVKHERCGDYLYLLGSVFADKLLPKLDPGLHYTLISCAEDQDHFTQGFIDRIEDSIKFSQMVFWMSDDQIPPSPIPKIYRRFVERDYTKSHEVIFIRPFVLNPYIPSVSLIDVADRIRPSKFHVCGIFVDEDVLLQLDMEHGFDFCFEKHSFVDVDHMLGDRVYVWDGIESDMYRSLGFGRNKSVKSYVPDCIKKKMLVRS